MLPRSWLPAVLGLSLFVASALTPPVRAAVVLTPVVRQMSLDGPAQSDPTIVRSRYVAMAAGVLPVPSGTDPRLDLATPPILLDLFDDVSVVAVFDRFDPNPRGVTWVGHVKGSEGSTVTLVYGDDGLVQGNVLTLDGTYTIRPAPDAVRASNPQTAGVLHVIEQIDLSRRRPIARPVSVRLPAADRAGSTAGVQPLADTGDFIDVLVVYTPAAAAVIGGAAAMRSRIELFVSETNTSYANSGVTQRLRLSHVAQVPYADVTSDDSHFANLENLRTGAPGLEGVAALRDLYRADVVQLVARNDAFSASCGIAYHMENPSAAFEAFAFSVIDIWCASTTHLFAELLGTNMGLRYDWFNDNGTTPYMYAHGHTSYAGDADSRFSTLMASHELCSSVNIACPQLLRWSNPTQTYNGVPLGVPAGTRANCAMGASDANTCDADSRLALNNTALVVANFRDAPEAPPGALSKSAPVDQTVLAWNTFAPRLSWQSAPFAESYAYCYDTTNNDTCDGTWTPTTALSVQLADLLPGTTLFWQVRAVNAYGVTLANGGTWWRLTKQVAPPAPFGKTAPASGALGQATTLTLTWQASADAASYEYCYDATNNSACDGSWISTGATTALVTGLSAASVYYWQVRAVNISGSFAADFGSWWSFATISDPPPSYPVTTLAGLAGASGGTDGVGNAARFTSPAGVAVDLAGTIYVADSFERTIRKITPAGVVTTLAGLARTTGSTDGVGSAARFNSPKGVAVDTAGTVYVADTGNHTIRKITPAGAVTTLAGLAGSSGFTDGVGSAARFTAPEGVAVDAAGIVYVADTSRNTIRKITPAGAVSTLAGHPNVAAGNTDGVGSAARFFQPAGVAVDDAGIVYVADRSNNRIRKITPAGAVTTLAGLSSGSADGVGSAARFNQPSGVAVDSAGMVYVADTGNYTLRRITPLAVVTTLAGQAGSFGSADGVGSAARFLNPSGVAVDSISGTLYVADRDNSTIRRRGPAIGGPNLITNGDFGAGAANWNLFATPDSSYLSLAVVNGVFEFTRVPPPPGASGSATVYQNTGQALPAGTSLLARFALGNSSTVRKRISVLVLDHNFSDLSVCTFWLPPQTPLTTYGMRTYNAQAWANASIYFYAATAGSDGGAYRVDDVSLQVQPGGPTQATTCLDPLAPAATGDPAGSTLLGNGDFASGTLGPWAVFGTITHQIAGGVFEFVRPNNSPPAGVVFQATGQAMAANQVLTATFKLGNSSAVRKRVTVIVHDSDFSDLSACTFWLAPGQALSDYVYRTYTTKAWTNAMISVYAATTDTQPWMRLDDVTLQRTPGTAIPGTQCGEPGGG